MIWPMIIKILLIIINKKETYPHGAQSTNSLHSFYTIYVKLISLVPQIHKTTTKRLNLKIKRELSYPYIFQQAK